MAKSNSSITTSVPHLPMDLIADNILTRLPVKSLCRFKSVSKPWFSLIESPHFINLHLNFSKLNPNPIFSSILSSVYKTGTDKYLFRLNLINAIDKPIDMDFSIRPGRRCRVLGISNGLLCVMFGSGFCPDTIIVGNPVTGNLRTIPLFDAKDLLKYYSFYGFNSNENGFELIRVNCSYDSVKVISFSSRANIWKDVEVKMGKHISTEPMMSPEPLYRDLVPVFKSGIFYWEVLRQCSIVVLILDLFNEEFDVIPAPGDYDFVDLVGLVGFKEQIMIVFRACTQLHLWILNENDKTWRMLKLIDVYDSIPEDDLVPVLGCTGNGQLVFRRVYDSHSEVYLCDINSDDTNILTYVNVERMDRMYLFAESLKSVKPSEFGDGV